MCEEEVSMALMSGQILVYFFHSSSLSGPEPKESLKKINSSICQADWNGVFPYVTKYKFIWKLLKNLILIIELTI